MQLRRTLFGCLLVLSTVPLGCSSGGGGDPVGPGDGGDLLENVTPSSNAPQSLSRVDLQGLPAARAIDLDLRVEFVDVEDAGTLPVECDDEGVYYFNAPFHPLTPAEGGTVTMRVRAGEQSSPDFTLDLDALDDAPGAFAALVQSVAAHVDGFAQRVGSSRAALRELSFEATPNRLLPLKYAQSFVDDPQNPNALAAIASGESDLLSTSEIRLLDQICGFTGLTTLLDLEVDALDELDPPLDPGAALDRSAPRRACIEAGPAIANADQLSSAMWEAKFAEIAITGAAGNTLTALGTTFAVGAAIPGAGLPFTALGAATAAWQASRGALAGLNPSSFVSIEAEIDRPRFEEDSEELGRYSNVIVVATSKGWSVDQAILDGVIAALGVYASTAKAAQITASNFLSGVATGLVNQSASTYVGSREGGVISFCPQQWTVDISSPAWCEARAVFGRFQVASGAQTYRPTQFGEDFLSVSNIASEFGQESIDIDLPIGVDAIVVRATPQRITVTEPGEVVQITATVENADVRSLYWDSGPGTWNDGLLSSTNEPRTRPLVTPLARSEYPFLVKIESLSRQGLRATGDPERFDLVTIALDEEIVVSPANSCLDPGATEQFTAMQGDQPAAVTWSLETLAGAPSNFGSISANGLYTAPGTGSGSVVVVATSTTEPTQRGTALVEVAACSCFWALSIESEGAWSGAFAGHGFPSTFGLFTLTFDGESGSTTGSVLAISDPVTEGETGVFQPENFGFQIGNRSWVATSDPEDQTSVELIVTRNSGGVLQGSLRGTCLTFIDGEAFYRSFDLNFRSGDLGSGEPICGED